MSCTTIYIYILYCYIVPSKCPSASKRNSYYSIKIDIKYPYFYFWLILFISILHASEFSDNNIIGHINQKSCDVHIFCSNASIFVDFEYIDILCLVYSNFWAKVNNIWSPLMIGYWIQILLNLNKNSNLVFVGCFIITITFIQQK